MQAMTEQHKGYSESTARRVIEIYRALQRVDDVVTISEVARRSRVSRSTARAVLRQEGGWTPAQSFRAHRAGIRRGQLVQAISGHQGLARGRETMELQGWPNLQRANRTVKAKGFPGLQRGRATQAAQGWPRLVAAQASQAASGYLHLAQGRANLAERGWPNWKKAHAVLKEQEYIPLLEAQRRRSNKGAVEVSDRRLRRGRSTRLAIVEALQVLKVQKQSELETGRLPGRRQHYRVTGHEVAAYLQLHPSTVYGHLKQLRAAGVIE
jgi:DNA-binding transcriptional ArsR family regulator